jgi:Cu(I)/Ag(I) efflux system membrane fusion protein
MNKKTVLIVLIILVMILLVVIIFFIKADNKKTKTLYHCPMHPDYVSDKPGDCPICGMKLVPMDKNEEIKDVKEKENLMQNMKIESMQNIDTDKERNDRTTIKISPEKQQMIGVKTDIVAKRELGKSILANGVVAYDPELYYAQQQYLSLLNSLKKESPDSELEESLKSAKMRFKIMGLSDKQIQEISKMKGPDKSLLLSDENAGAWIYAYVYQDDLPDVKIGSKAEITVAAIRNKIFNGKVVAIAPSLNPEKRSVRVRIFIENSFGLLKPEMYVNVKIKSVSGVFLSIPEDAIIDTGSKQIAFVNKEDGYFEPREVIIESKIGDYYVIRAGLSEGEKVVTSANFLIDSESQLKAAIGNMSGHKH